MTDPFEHTLGSALEELRRSQRNRALGELVESAAWWLDVQSGTTPSASSWRLATTDLNITEARLTEAPYLAAIGYLSAIQVVPMSDAIGSAATRVLRRAAHTIERRGFADDPLILGGLVLLARVLGRDVAPLRDEVEKVLATDPGTATAALLTLIEPSIAAHRRPFGTCDVIDAAIAVVVDSANTAVASTLFPSLDAEELRAGIMAAACSGELNPASELERAFAAIALGLTVANAVRTPQLAQSVEKASEVDVAIIVALREEFRHLHASIPGAIPIELGGHQYYRSNIGDYSIVAAFVGDMGPVAAALASSRLIETWKPRNVVLLGIAGGVSKDVALGDVVVGTQVDSYLDAGKAVDDEHAFALLPSGAAFRADRQLVSRVRNLEFTRTDLFNEWQKRCGDRRDKDPALAKLADLPQHTQLHDGTIASGPIVGASDKFRDWLLRRERGYKAVEMEGGAVMWAAEQAWAPPRTLVVRGISDRADPGKAALDDVGKGAVRGWAMQNAIAFVRALLDARVLVK